MVFECRNGLSWNSTGAVDAFAIQTWESKAPHYIAMEIKVNRADFRRELANPAKRRWAEEASTEFVFVAPRGVIPVDELPDGAGLLETWGDKLRWTRRAVQRKGEPDWTLWTLLMRQLTDVEVQRRKEEGHFASFRGRDISLEDLRELAKKAGYSLEDSDWRIREKAQEMRREAVAAHHAFWDPRKVVIVEAERLAEAVLGVEIPQKGVGWPRRKDPKAVAAALSSISDVSTLRNGKLARKLREAADALDGDAAEACSA